MHLKQLQRTDEKVNWTLKNARQTRARQTAMHRKSINGAIAMNALKAKEPEVLHSALGWQSWQT